MRSIPVFKSRFPDVEVNGQTIYAVVDGMGAFKGTALNWLEEVGIKDLQPEKYYSEQAWLDCFTWLGGLRHKKWVQAL